MTAATAPAASAGDDQLAAGPPPSVTARAYFRLAGGFWTGPTRRSAWLLTIGVLGFVLANLAAALGINRWNRFFFDALEQRDVPGVLWGIVIVAGLVAFSALVTAGLLHLRMRLQLRWREWLTGHLIRRWLSDRRFYQLTIVTGGSENPEYRIADDVRLAVEPLVEFIIGLSNALLAALAFIGVLWSVGGSLTAGSVTIPGYMVVAALAYCALTSAAVVFLGRPLIRHVESKNAGEARLRYELTRVRDSAENIALIGGDDDERRRLEKTFRALAARWLKVIAQQTRIAFVGNANTVLSPIVPLILGAPKYLHGEMSLGELMQVATAFVQVQIALNWLVDNAIRLAEWLASAQRVVELTAALDMLDQTIGRTGMKHTVVLGESPDDAIHIEHLTITQQNGLLMIEGAHVRIARGEKILVKGESGTGKSTLIRAMAGLWPWGTGRILRPPNARMAFLPQQPYLPQGTLRRALLYPGTERPVGDEALAEALERCGLGHLVPRLDEDDHWSAILSGGEKQRLAFARLLVDPPDIAIMDEATSALDDISQSRMMEFLRTDLAKTTILNVTHRPGLEEYHDGEINLIRVDAGHAVTHDWHYPRLRQLWQKLVRADPAAAD
jgi:putative ATP-binding cassette transporter